MSTPELTVFGPQRIKPHKAVLCPGCTVPGETKDTHWAATQWVHPTFSNQPIII